VKLPFALPAGFWRAVAYRFESGRFVVSAQDAPNQSSPVAINRDVDNATGTNRNLFQISSAPCTVNVDPTCCTQYHYPVMPDANTMKRTFLRALLPLCEHARAIVVIPFVLVGMLWIPALFPNGFRIFTIITTENGPVEMPTFLLALLATWISFQHALTLRHNHEAWWVWSFYIFFAAGMFFIAGEEIAWGQQFLHFHTPEYWSKINAQHETTLHNVGGLQGHSEYFRLVFCLGCLVGFLAGRFRPLALVAVPPLLWSWLGLMAAFVLLDTSNDFLSIQPDFDRYVNKFSEVVELMISAVACLYVRLNAEAYAARARIRPA